MSKQLQKDFNETVQSASRVALIAAVRRNTNATISEVFNMAKQAKLDQLSVQEIFFEENIGFEPAKALLAAEGKKGKAIANMHSPTQRAEYDERVLASIPKTGWVRSEKLNKKVGGTPLQRRKALGRLVKSGQLQSQGEARGTEYRLPKLEKKKKKGKKGKGKKNKGKKNKAAAQKAAA